VRRFAFSFALLFVLGALAVSATIEKIGKPSFAGAVKFVVPKRATERGLQAPAFSIQLPKGTNHGFEPFIFVGSKGAFVDVTIEDTGPTVAHLLKGFRADTHLDGIRFSAGSYEGEYEEHMLRDGIRRARLYTVFSPTMAYTMMVSWPYKNLVARKEAISMAQFVLWSFKSQ
jgi:hypothetical protein